MLQSKILRGFMLGAGLWLTASAALAAPQPGQVMKLGASALPPKGYVAFCKRRPQDCGEDPTRVLEQAARAEAERRALSAMAAAAQDALAGAPAALSAPRAGFVNAASIPIPPVEASLLPVPEPLVTVVERAPPPTQVAFVDPAERGGEEARRLPPEMTPALWSRLNRINARVNHKIAQREDATAFGVADYWAAPLAEGLKYGDCEDYVLEKQRALAAAGVDRRALNIALVTTAWGESHAVLVVSTRDGDYVLDNLSPWVLRWEQTNLRWRQRQVDGDAFTWAMVEPPAEADVAPSAGRLLIALAR